MNLEVMRTVHTCVHHEDAGLDNCAFTGLEYHRTDGYLRRSAPLQYFNVRSFLETQCAVACIGDFYGKSFIDAKFHIAKIDLLLIHRDGGRSAAISTLICEEERSYQQNTANRYKRPREIFSLFLLPEFFLARSFTPSG